MDNLTPREMLKTVMRVTKAVTDRAASLAAERGYDLRYVKGYSAGSYRAGIIDAARSFWKEGSRGNFSTRMNTLIKFGLNDAWVAGAALVNVNKDEFEQEDWDEIGRIVAEEKSHVADLLDYLDTLANDPKGSLQSAMPRLEMWANRFNDVVNQAMVWFGGKTRLKWVMGPTEDHCDSCGKLNGIVAWAREWETADIRPQSHDLQCHGYNCLCRLEPTTQRRSPRALERIRSVPRGG